MSPRDFVTEQLSIILGVPVQPTDVQVERFWGALSRKEEVDAPKDAHGNFPPEQSQFSREGRLVDPPLHEDVIAFAKEYPAVTPRWPRGHRFAACLTHDVDRIVKLPWRERWRQLATLHGSTSAKQAARWAIGGAVYATGAMAGRSDIAPFDYWLAEEGRFGFHSTFFVLPEEPVQPTFFDHYYRYADPIRYRGQRMTFCEGARLAQEDGWEIGVHGSYVGAYDEAIFCREKEQVEAMLGGRIISARQHFLRFACQTTPRVQAAAGIQADSTLGYSSTIGCRAGLAFPYFWPDTPELLEVPLIIQDVGLLRTQGQAFTYEAAIDRARTLITRIAEVGGVVTLSWHTHPESPGALPAYRTLLETIAELGGWGCSLGELNYWWRARRTAIRDSTKKRPAYSAVAANSFTEAA